MIFFKRLFLTVGLVAAAAICSGCMALAVPSLAYQGYKYEKSKQSNQQRATNSTAAKRPVASQQSIPESEIQ
jgi:uncharacterized membrane protein YebE (DUF533 family)